MTYRVMIAALSSLLMAGCVIPPSDAPRETPLAAADVGLNAASAPAAPKAWWKSFGDPQFDKLVDDALAHNPTLAEALARMRGAEARVTTARSQSLPQVSVNAEEQRQKFSGTYIYPPPFAGNWNWIGSTEANLTWNLDFWGKQAALVSQAGDNADAARLDAESARLAIAGALAQAYIGLDRAYVLADVATETEAQRQHILDLTRQRTASGIDSKVEIREAEALLAQARVAKTEAESNRDLATHEVAALAGLGANAYAGIRRPHLNLEAALPLPAALPADLLARRPDVLASRLRIEAALAGRKAAKAAFYPDINLAAFAGFQAIGLDSLFKSPSEAFGVGPAIHLPIFDADNLKSQYIGATAEVDDAIAGYNGTVLGAVHTVADRVTEISALASEAADEQQSLDAASEAYRLAERRYGAGLSTYLSVLSAETLLLDARQSHATLAAAQATNRVQLLLAVGGDFTPAPKTASAAPRAAPAQVAAANQ
ncbi:MAG TPA: efflux transporter outer membrane subunit [Parvibaculum sp.]